MKIGHTIDSDGFLLEDILEGSGITPDVTALCPDGFYKPKWNGGAWIEGLTQQEIDDLKNAPVTPSVEERLQAAEEVLTSLMGI